jgi:hypothetical protein
LPAPGSAAMQNWSETHETWRPESAVDSAPSVVTGDQVPLVSLNVWPSSSIAMQNVGVAQEIASNATPDAATCVRADRVEPNSV